ncbi:nuclear transport factor 2 family protein [Cupriavidus sp. AcVe19-6a]|uniref:nuclear transport factor 2 family protein n=1 Tax=Cupriavidus sp. AcVe19-6a TaxID=2821358 RepID=UPI001AE2D108|nr:nuclear transport factor 2 family protein [Cupriavidus sp. AcVe19-6a]MBP0638812.1 nuclear transport factor 2 family protein [Cupriavidus sp. AcVe19-6a]
MNAIDRSLDPDAVAAEIARLENERCRALVAADVDALDALVADDVIHIHANGKVDDKPAYLAIVRSQITFLSAQREGLEVRVQGDMAVAVGRLLQSIEMRETGQRIEMDVMTTQAWRREAGRWRQVTFQATNR